MDPFKLKYIRASGHLTRAQLFAYPSFSKMQKAADPHSEDKTKIRKHNMIISFDSDLNIYNALRCCSDLNIDYSSD